MIDEVQECPNPIPFRDTPLLAAKRKAFDDPTIENLDALIAVAQDKNPKDRRRGYHPEISRRMRKVWAERKAALAKVQDQPVQLPTINDDPVIELK